LFRTGQIFQSQEHDFKRELTSISTSINLRYGKTSIPFEHDEARFLILGHEEDHRPLTDADIGQKLDGPIDSPTMEETVSPGDSVLIVVPDATRQTGAGQVVNLIVRRLIANGVSPNDIRIIFATGIHRRVTENEKSSILTHFIAQRIKTLDHDPRDLMQIVHLGETSGGIPVELNRALTEHDHVVLVGGVSFHYFAGFTGGRKLVCPGLGSTRTISSTHKLAFNCETRCRREGVGTGMLDGNAVHEAFIEAAEFGKPSFSINTIVNDGGEIVALFCGDWVASHRKACDTYASSHAIRISERREVVIASCGGYPHDINMIQAHKTLEAASQGCREGGTIILLAECADGLGRKDFLDWFNAENSEDLAARLCDKYQVNGQTAWSLLRKAECFDIRIVSGIDATTAEKMRLTPMQSLSRAFAKIDKNANGYILPFGAKFLPVSDRGSVI